jgi:pimeloyl-ACP methyl ester carboxylesterase
MLRWLAAALEALPFLRDDQVAQSGMRFIYNAACPATRAAFTSAAREMALDPAFGADGFWTRLPALRVPAAFVWGGRDQLISLRFAGAVARRHPQARQLVLPCVGHWWNGPHHRCLAEALVMLLDAPGAAEVSETAPRPEGLPARRCLFEPPAANVTPATIPAEEGRHAP